MAKKSVKKKANGVSVFVGIWNTVTWISIMAAMILISIAKPEVQTVFEDKYGKTARTIWLMNYVENAYYICIGALLFAIVGLFIHAGLISGQKKKHVSYGLVFATIYCIFSVIILYFEFMR